MSIYSPGSIFHHESEPTQVEFKEVNLPFEDIPGDQDYISGEELYDTLTSREVSQSLEDYSVSGAQHSNGGFEIMAVDDSYFSLREPSYISFEGEKETFQNGELTEARYHHLRVELAAPDDESMEALREDLDLLKQGLEDYYDDANSEAQVSGRQAYIAD